MEERIEDLEVKLAYQDRLISDLDALVRKFGARLDETVRELATIKQALRSGEPTQGPGNEPPPHY